MWLSRTDATAHAGPCQAGVPSCYGWAHESGLLDSRLEALDGLSFRYISLLKREGVVPGQAASPELEAIRTELLVRKKESTELANVSCNRALLRQLAAMTSGEMIEPWNTARLLTLLQPDDQSSEEVQERTLWDHWWVLIVLFSLMMTEWVIRKLNGLP